MKITFKSDEGPHEVDNWIYMAKLVECKIPYVELGRHQLLVFHFYGHRKEFYVPVGLGLSIHNIEGSHYHYGLGIADMGRTNIYAKLVKWEIKEDEIDMLEEVDVPWSVTLEFDTIGIHNNCCQVIFATSENRPLNYSGRKVVMKLVYTSKETTVNSVNYRRLRKDKCVEHKEEYFNFHFSDRDAYAIILAYGLPSSDSIW